MERSAQIFRVNRSRSLQECAVPSLDEYEVKRQLQMTELRPRMCSTACSRHSAWGSKRLDQRLRLGERLLILRRRLGIPHDGGCGVERSGAALHHDRPDRDVEV